MHLLFQSKTNWESENLAIGSVGEDSTLMKKVFNTQIDQDFG